MSDISAVAIIASALLSAGCVYAAASAEGRLQVNISWGYHTPRATDFHLELHGNGLAVAGFKGVGLEADDSVQGQAVDTHSGAGDVDGVECLLEYPAAEVREITKLHAIWRDLIAQSDLDTARRLCTDPAYRHDDRRLTVQMDREGTRGFTLTIDQLLANRAFWVPALDVYVTTGGEPVSFAQHQAELKPWEGRRILDQVHAEEEATLAQYTARWADMGSPAYQNGSQPAPGHIVCLTWDSALCKFGIDRGAGVRNDLGNPDQFQLNYDFGELNADLVHTWRGQKIVDGLPLITTAIERDGVRYEIQQFAHPLNGPPAERRGDIPMLLFQRLRVSNPGEQPRTATFHITHRRKLAANAALQLRPQDEGTFLCEESDGKAVVLSVQGRQLSVAADTQKQQEAAGAPRRVGLAVSLKLPAGGTQDLIIKLASPPVPAVDCGKLLALDFDSARAATTKFWSDYLGQGAYFSVPEPAVNELFRANLWHALRLPRRHGGTEQGVRIDLPYSNFAYGQNGIPWPVNQAVYVDYMLYDLRGYHRLSAEELLAMYRANQEADGHVRGYANWTVYTPGMVYASAQHFLLSGDLESFNALLPATLKAADWCLAQIKKSEPQGGLVAGPLNDLTGDGVWAFSQAYFYAGLDLLAAALQRAGHPRAAEMRQAAEAFGKALQRGFAAACLRSPLVQLRDHTWAPYVPCEAHSAGRRLDQWYPTDVDTGALHLPRLKAIAPEGLLADCLLHDHEDNLYLKGWGMANEPVYNQQATVYLLRDDPKAAVRAFYSYIACAFSHSALEPVEHRWTHGQYFGPPSTDGAWFELYRNMLIQERENDTLLLLAATPRAWLEDGKRIEVRGAPTHFGPLDMVLESRAAEGKISVKVQTPSRVKPRELLVRLRHPQSKPIRSVLVNGREWARFEAQKEWVRITNPEEARYEIIVSY